MSNSRQTLLLVFSVISLLGFGPCAMSTQEICTRRLPELQKEISDAQKELAQPANRSIASAENPALTDSETGNPWLKWSVHHLEEAQHYLDLSYEQPKLKPVRDSLSNLATDWVLFYGYARHQKIAQMRLILSEIDRRNQSVQAHFCSAP